MGSLFHFKKADIVGCWHMTAFAAPTARQAMTAVVASKEKTAFLNVEHVEGDGDNMFEAACRPGLEGIVSKRMASPYQSGPSKAWLKTKNPQGLGGHARGQRNLLTPCMFRSIDCRQRGLFQSRMRPIPRRLAGFPVTS